MAINSDHVTGLVVGVGVSALGFYLYMRNQAQIDEWLRKQGINVPTSPAKNPDAMSLDELRQEKERLEDLIAERELAEKSKSPAGSAEA